MFYKDTGSQKIAVFAYDSTDGTPKTGDAANITAQISLDGGTAAATNDVNPTELDATDHPGIYLFDMTQAETNADLINLTPVSSTSDILLEPVIIYTEPTLRTANVTQISGDSAAADNLESACDNYSATRGLAGTALPDAAADAAGGLPISDGGGLDLDSRLDADVSSRNATTPPTADAIRDAILNRVLNGNHDTLGTPGGLMQLIEAMRGTDGAYTGTPPTAAAIADAVLDEATGDHTNAGSLSKAIIDALADTDELQTNQGNWVTATGFSTHDAAAVWSVGSRVLTAGTNLNDLSVADVLGAEVTENTSVPGASPTLEEALSLLYMALRNKIDVTSSAKEVHNDAGTVLGTKALSDDGTTYSEGKMA